MDSSKKNNTKRARKEGHHGINKNQDKGFNFKQVWVKKALLKAQGDDTYKWVPKHDMLDRYTHDKTGKESKKA